MTFGQLGINATDSVDNYGRFWARSTCRSTVRIRCGTRPGCPRAAFDRTNGNMGKCSTDCWPVEATFSTLQHLDRDVMDFPSSGYLQPPPWNLAIPGGVWPVEKKDTEDCYNSTSMRWNRDHAVMALKPSYCLAEPLNRICMMGVSVPLLLTVTVSVFLKTALSVTVVYRLPCPALQLPVMPSSRLSRTPTPSPRKQAGSSTLARRSKTVAVEKA